MLYMLLYINTSMVQEFFAEWAVVFQLLHQWHNNKGRRIDFRRCHDRFNSSPLDQTDFNSNKIQIFIWLSRFSAPTQGLYWLCGKTSYCQISSRSLEAAREYVTAVVMLWNSMGISVALLPRGLSNFRAIGKVLNPNLAVSKFHEILL